MINAGEIICFRGPHRVKNPYYYIPTAKLVLAAAKNVLGDYKIYDVDGNVTVELEEKVDVRNGLLVAASICVTFSDGKKKSYIISYKNRICPECYRSEAIISLLPETMGYEDTYIIGVLGRTSVGKTAWIDSSCLDLTANELSRMTVENRPTAEQVTYEATQMNEDRENLTREITVTNRRGKRKACVFFNDTPGEFLTLKAEERGPNHDYFERYVKLCDGIVYVVAKNDYHVENLNWLTFLSKNTPVAIVMSKLDELEKETREAGGVLKRDGKILVTNEYFARKREEKSFSEMIENQLVDKYVIRQLCPALKKIATNKSNITYFGVSSGLPANNRGTVLDLTKRVNVFAPLLFMMKYWGLR